MIDLPIHAWVLLVGAAVIVGISKTALPGAATLAVVVFASILPARSSTAALLMLLIVGDILALVLYRRHAVWSTLWRLAPAVAIGIAVGAIFLALADDHVMRRSIGAMLLLLVGVTVILRRVPAQAEHRRGALLGYGVLGGWSTMVANAGGPVMSLYFLAARFDVRSFLGTAAWFFAIVNVAKLPIVVGLGLVTLPLLWLDLFLVPAVVIGALLGRAIAHRITQSIFNRVVLVLTATTALWLLVGPV